MDVYYLVFVITLILSKILPAHNDREYLRKVIIIFIPLLLFAALRVNFGYDYFTYEAEYEQLHDADELDSSKHIELGFQYLLYIAPSWRFVVVLSAIILCLSWIVLFYKYVEREYLYFAVILIFCTGNFTIYLPLVTMRNGMTIALMMLSLPLIIKRKYLYVLTLAYVGSFLHTSILMFLPLALIIGTNKELSRREVMIWLITLFVLFISSNSSILNFLEPYILKYFGNYDQVLTVMSDYDHDSTLINIANLFLFSCVMIFFYKYRTKLIPSENSYFRIGLVYLLCSFMGPLGSSRMQAYFLPFFLLIIVRMYSMKWKSNNILKLSFFTFIFVYYLYRFFYVWQWNNPYFAFEEYQSIFSLT